MMSAWAGTRHRKKSLPEILTSPTIQSVDGVRVVPVDVPLVLRLSGSPVDGSQSDVFLAVIALAFKRLRAVDVKI